MNVLASFGRFRSAVNSAVERSLRDQLKAKDDETMELEKQIAILKSKLDIRNTEVKELTEAHAHAVNRWIFATRRMASEFDQNEVSDNSRVSRL